MVYLTEGGYFAASNLGQEKRHFADLTDYDVQYDTFMLTKCSSQDRFITCTVVALD